MLNSCKPWTRIQLISRGGSRSRPATVDMRLLIASRVSACRRAVTILSSLWTSCMRRSYDTRTCMNSDRSGSSCMDPIRVESQFNESTACMQNFSPAARERDVQRIELTQLTMPSHHTDRYTGDWTSSECFDGIRYRHQRFITNDSLQNPVETFP